MSRRQIVLGVTGGIAAFKSAALTSQLVQNQTDVTVVMTSAASEFVGATTFAALTGRAVATCLFDRQYPLGAHIELADWADALCIAPASADFLGKMAQGLADDLLSTIYLCFDGPVIVAPAMNDRMWLHTAVQRNVSQLQADGVHFVEPQAGWLSCRQTGVGRMAEPDQIQTVLDQYVPPTAKA